MKKIIIQPNGTDNLLLKHIADKVTKSKRHLSFRRELMEFQGEDWLIAQSDFHSQKTY